jgi:hypothetical protein
LSFATDAWTSPNHKALVAITVHFKHEGIPISLLLDIVEVARSHSGFEKKKTGQMVMLEKKKRMQMSLLPRLMS